MADDWERLADRLTARRGELHLTQDEVVALSGLSIYTVWRAEQGQARLRPKSRRAYEPVLGWAAGSIDEVLAGGEPTVLPDEDPMPRDVIPDVADIILEIMRRDGPEAGEAALQRALDLAAYAYERETTRDGRSRGAS